MQVKVILTYFTLIFVNFFALGLIVGGREVIDFNIPFVVSIQKPNQNGVLQHHCGGSIYDRYHVITRG
jgi:hypothetical protein